MATTTYYPSSDGDIYVINATFSTARGAASGTLRSGETTYAQCHYASGDGGYVIDRAFLNIDTSGLGSGVTISSASLFLKSIDTLSASTHNAGIFSASCSSPLDAGDFDTNSSTNVSDTYKTRTEWNTAAGSYIEFALNADGRGETHGIKKTGTTKIALTSKDLDVDNVAPSTVSDEANRLRAYFAGIATAGTDSDPYLSVTYTTASGPATPSGSLGLLGCGM